VVGQDARTVHGMLNGRIKSRMALQLFLALLAVVVLRHASNTPTTDPAPAQAESQLTRFRTCATLLKRYPHGIARSRSESGSGSIPVSPAQYRRNTHLDTDSDGVLCGTPGTPQFSAPSTTQVQQTSPVQPSTTVQIEASSELLSLVNDARQSAGVSLVLECGPLSSSASAHALDMFARTYFSHQSPEGTYPWDRALAAGYGSGVTGENLTLGPRTAAEAIDEWMRSDSHRRNLLNPKWEHVGHGVATKTTYGTPKTVWVQVFGAGGSC
jgi:uncharacterized protein YkwD